MSNNELSVTLLNHEDIKSSLIEFLKSTNEFSDFDYDGSAINTLIDLLTRNSTYAAYLANMVANESFIDSAQIRDNVVSHAQKLSYTPRSVTASRLVCDITVTPSNVSSAPPSIVMDTGSTFLTNIDGQTYSFTNQQPYTLELSNGQFKVTDVELIQGQLLTNKFVYQGTPLTVPNQECDTSTLLVTVNQSGETSTFNKAGSLTQLGANQNVFFLGEKNLKPEITFGKDVLGEEPLNSSIISVSYIAVDQEFANGVGSLIAATSISNYSDVNVTVTTKSYGGQDRETVDDIRFIAPKMYQAQGRALTDTDYIPIIKSEYPYIKSVITWGGEDNDPPTYGKVFMSFISDEGTFLTDSIKEQIVSYLKDYNVGSITPEIVDPVGYGLDLFISFNYDYRKTSKTFNQLSNDIHSVVNTYNENNINEFSKFYNDSLLVDKIMGIEGIVSVNIDVSVYRKLDVLTFNNPVYAIDFKNQIKPGSVSVTDFKVDVNGLNHKLYDDGEGTLFVEYTKDGATISQEVGEVDYDSGKLDFVINMLQTNDFKVYAKPVQDNFYINQNAYAFIDDVEFGVMNLKGV